MTRCSPPRKREGSEMPYIVDELVKQSKEVACGLPDGRYVMARPLTFYGWWGFKRRLRDAWGVLTGKYDAIQWIEQ
jgi:hypothetical protein